MVVIWDCFCLRGTIVGMDNYLDITDSRLYDGGLQSFYKEKSMRKTILCGIASLGIAFSAAADSATWQDEIRVQQTQEIVDGVLVQSEIDTIRHSSSGPRVFGFGQFRWSYDSLGIMGFDVRKAVIGVEGNLADGWDYVVSGQFTPGNSFSLREAYVNANYDQWSFRAGRFRMPFMAEWQVNEPQLLGNDYSLIAYTFGQGYSEGVSISYSFTDDIVARFSYNNGFENPNVNPFSTQTWGLSGRLEVNVDPNFRVGAALAYNSMDDLGENMTWTVDANLRFSSQLFGFFSYTGRSDSSYGDGWGILAQAGYDLDCCGTSTIFAQYELGEINGSSDLLSILSLGYTHKFASNVRWTNQFGYSFNAISDSWNVNDTGWRTSNTDGQFLFTSQFTISF
jgi:hypothetical protein